MPEFRPLLGYGSQTGNAELLARDFLLAAKAVDIDIRSAWLNDVTMKMLAKHSHLVVITSTYGEGELPDNAVFFEDELDEAAEGALEHLAYAVLALGDSSYENFATAGQIVHEGLGRLGARAISERVNLDDDYKEEAAQWIGETVALLAAERDAANTPGTVPAAADTSEVGAAVVVEPVPTTPEVPGRDPEHPVAARVVVNRLLSGAGSDKEVRHYEMDLAGTGLTYAAGDVIAVHAPNDPALVAALLAALDLPADHVPADEQRPVAELFADHWEIRTPSRALLDLVVATRPQSEAARALAGSAAEREVWLYGKDVVDLVRMCGLSADELLPTLRRLHFREYSIASSPLVNPDRVGLTVATVRHESGGRARGGVASTFLADRSAGVEIGVHLRPNEAFRLPADDVPVVMIGPGTGIAPFRGFLQERAARAAGGRSWLFFGDRHREHDFPYQDEVEAFVADGTLARLDLAFSRDQPEKVYVQHLMLAAADELFAWLEDGAHVYVCGDEKHMARDVDAALRALVSERVGGAEAGKAYVDGLIRQRRYVRDVY